VFIFNPYVPYCLFVFKHILYNMKVALILTGLMAIVAAQKGTKGSGGTGAKGIPGKGMGGSVPKAGQFSRTMSSDVILTSYIRW
jgi:hypothetical protein